MILMNVQGERVNVNLNEWIWCLYVFLPRRDLSRMNESSRPERSREVHNSEQTPLCADKCGDFALVLQDQRVNWHTTPFETRLEQALATQTTVPTEPCDQRFARSTPSIRVARYVPETLNCPEHVKLP